MSWSPVVATAVVALALPLATGCGPNCQSTCNRLYTSGGDNCNIERPGMDQVDLIDQCMDVCEFALQKPGDVGSYDPNNLHGSSSAVDLENEKQAAVWMDCIANTACEDLENGLCAPIW